ncbi:parafibromin-like [Anthonomus grandis grandis]|uniref:parafibromin-like n=1 Tax=Anthonomus grandis grandis TaxID=2921223 RepID=UPI0021662FA0|nr:parafibromin-like [Anthonomus grandis grandis]
MSNMADPLTLLREYNMNQMEIIEKDGRIYFGDLSWPKDVETRYIMWTEPRYANAPKKYYTLQTLLHILKNKSLIHPAYARKAESEGIPAVRRPDRVPLLAYLNGKTDTSPSIDKNAPIKKPKLEHQVPQPHINVKTEDTSAFKAEIIEDARTKTPKLEPEVLQPISSVKTEDTSSIKQEIIEVLDDSPERVPKKVKLEKEVTESLSAEKIAEIKAKRLAKKAAQSN